MSLTFLHSRPPENYVAGLGRGATGFTTRSDLGPAREGPSEEQMKELLAKRAQAIGSANPTQFGVPAKKEEDGGNNEDDERYQDPENEMGLLAGGVNDRDDDEADKIYHMVDEKMERRRKQRREEREKREQEEHEKNNPKINAQFTDLKRTLASVTEDEWASLPEVGDLTGKNKRQKTLQDAEKRFYAVPDSVIAGARDSGQFGTTVQDGEATDAMALDGPRETSTNFAEIGAARDKLLQVRLDQAAQTSDADVKNGISTNIDPKGYLTSLSKTESAGQVEVGDIKRVRTLLESVIKTNPKHAPGWIAAARLEELAGKMVAARNAIARGCEYCPKSEDAWLENIRLNEGQNAKIIAANAIKSNDRSARLWIEAMKLETVPVARKRVLRKAIDHIPQSVQIWREAVNLEEDPADARLLLSKATEVIPLSVDLWLALARLETPEKAQVVLNKARKAIPTSHTIWIAAARLQEQMGKPIALIMRRACADLKKVSAMPSREEWIVEAEKCEEEGATSTCQAIIAETIGYGLDEDDDRQEVWMDDAKGSMSRAKYVTARAIYAHTLQVFVNSKEVWTAAADLERLYGTKEALWSILEKAVEACPKSAVLWMALAKEKWQAGQLDDARMVLGKAFNQNPNNEDIWLSAVKLEADTGQVAQARELLAQARSEAGTDRVWIKSAAFERNHGDEIAALDLANQGLQTFPKADKLWMIKGQIYQAQVPIKLLQAREAYSLGTRACPKSVPLWLLASRLEEQNGALVKARSILDRARLANPKNPQLWTETVRVERRANNLTQARALIAKGLQEIPDSGLLWNEDIMYLQPRAKRKPLILEAIKRGDSDPILYVAISRIFWAERKLDKAVAWFEKAILLDSDIGDTWAWYFRFLMQHGTEEKRSEVIRQCTNAEPKHGEIWQSISKDSKLITSGALKAGVPSILLKVVERLEKEEQIK